MNRKTILRLMAYIEPSVSNEGRALFAILQAEPEPEPVAVAHPDDAAVDLFVVGMKQKLAQKRVEGKHGWQSNTWTPAEISQALRDHVEKGDPTDVANYCMFLALRNEPIAPRPKRVAKAWWIEDEDGYLRKLIPSPITDATYMGEGWIAIPLYKDTP